MGHKILLADDSITIQKVIELTFSEEDFELHTVGNGQKAIDEIRSIMPDVVLCDIIMPEKNGYEVCEFIKSSNDLKHIPVLLLTGAFEPFDQERAKAAGCEGFLAKPFEPQTLISRVKELLASASAPAATTAPAPAPPAPTPTPVAPISTESEQTVLVPPPAPVAGPPRASGPQVNATPAPAPAPPPLMEAQADVDDGFAVEAGERELAMGPADHTVLLGGKDTSPPPAANTGDEDVWGQVTAESQEEDAATVFMSAPPPIVEPQTLQPNEVVAGRGDPDATWQMPNDTSMSDDSSSSDAGGFQEFAEPPAPPPPAPPKPPTPPAAPPPPPRPVQRVEPEQTFEPTFDADPEPVTPEFEAVEAESFSEFESIPEPEAPFRSDETIDGVAASDPFEPVPVPERQRPKAPEAKPPSAPSPSPSHVASSRSQPTDGVDDALVEKVAQRVVDKLSAKIIQEIAWEVVPDLAEGLILKEIEALKAKIPK